MILVTLGTQDKSFDRLLKEIDKLIEKKVIKESVVAQVGYTKYESNNIKTFDFLSPEELNDLREKSSLIITHAGVGSILDSLKLNKKVIGVPRLKEYEEHTNNHQLQILEKFYKDGYIIKSSSVEDLENAIKESKNFKTKKYKSNTENMVKLIEDYIDNN